MEIVHAEMSAIDLLEPDFVSGALRFLANGEVRSASNEEDPSHGELRDAVQESERVLALYKSYLEQV
jgi:hypothetical protein